MKSVEKLIAKILKKKISLRAEGSDLNDTESSYEKLFNSALDRFHIEVERLRHLDEQGRVDLLIKAMNQVEVELDDAFIFELVYNFKVADTVLKLTGICGMITLDNVDTKLSSMGADFQETFAKDFRLTINPLFLTINPLFSDDEIPRDVIYIASEVFNSFNWMMEGRKAAVGGRVPEESIKNYWSTLHNRTKDKIKEGFLTTDFQLRAIATNSAIDAFNEKTD